MAEKSSPAPKTKTKTKTETNPSSSKAAKAPVVEQKNNSNKNIVIAVLVTVLVCMVLVFGILLATGVVKFGSGNNPDAAPRSDGPSQTTTSHKGDTSPGGDDDDYLIDNPNPRVAVNGTKVNVGDLEFYLPSQFEAGGKNDDGAYTYNLTNDDGWAQVLVYAEKSNLSPEKYLMKISPYLDITDGDYDFNGTEWVQAENANSLAYATKLEDKIYAIYYSVKLDSDATGMAMQMIPKTLYMGKIYADNK